MTVKNRQRAFSLGTLLLLSLLFASLYLYISQVLEGYTHDRIRVVTSHTSDIMGEWFANHHAAAEFAVAASFSAPSDESGLHVLVRTASVTSLGRHITLYVEGQGIQLWDNAVLTLPPEADANYALWLHLLSQPMEAPRMAGPMPSLSGAGSELVFMNPIYARNRQRIGVFALRVPLAALSKKLETLGIMEGKEGHVLIVEKTGTILAPPDAQGNPRRLGEKNGLSPLESLQLLGPTEAARILLMGNDFFACRQEIGETGWHVVLLSPAVQELHLLDILRLVLCITWILLAAFIFFLFHKARKYTHYKTLSELDHLTGVGNRLAFEKALTCLDNARDFPVSLLMMDVDGLKIVNDALGHEAGDVLLRNVAVLLQRSLRDNDTIYRIGGDEFAVILPGATHSIGRYMMERIKNNTAGTRDRVALPPIYISYGLAEATNTREVHSLYRRADEAMYANKNVGRNASSQAIRQWLLDNPQQTERRAPK